MSWSTFEDYIYRGDQVLAGFLSSGVQRHFDLDHLGTIRLVTNVAGNAVGTHRYYPYGKEQTALQEADRRKWAGHERDLGSLAGDGDDLDYMHARHYSPVTGRFVSVDPARASADPKLPQSWNRFSYSLNNPLKIVDRDGRVWDYALDVVGLAYDVYQLYQEPSWGNAGALALDVVLAVAPVVPTTGALKLASEGGQLVAGRVADGISITSRIGQDKSLARLAEEAGASVQKSLDHLVGELMKGNLSPGIGTRGLFGNIMEARTRDGARVYFRVDRSGKGVEILAKSNKKNQAQVIKRLEELYGVK